MGFLLNLLLIKVFVFPEISITQMAGDVYPPNPPIPILPCLQSGENRLFPEGYCTYQPASLRVTEGGSVTIQCTYSHQKLLSGNIHFKIEWTDPQPHSKVAYGMKQSSMLDRMNSGRNIRVINLERNRTGSITILNLSQTGHPQIFCKVAEFKDKHQCNSWTNNYGTALLFSDQTWVDQLDAIPALPGETIIIPCYINFPPWGKRTIKEVTWIMTNNCDHCESAEIHTWHKADKVGRYSVVNFPDDLSLRIENIQIGDGKYYRCRVRTNVGLFGRSLGTELVVKGQLWIEQMDAIPATIGENITIPCEPSDFPTTNVTVMDVIWRTSKSCYTGGDILKWEDSDLSPKGRFSVVDFPANLALHIENLQKEDTNYYCCLTLTSKGRFLMDKSTRLEVRDSRTLPGFTVIQPETSSLTQSGGSVIISCSYTHPQDKDPLNVRIYWRVGSPSGPYAYHPSEEMTDPLYRGRTELVRTVDLHILDVQVEDANTYYCFVMLTLCAESFKYKSVIDHGQGSTLTVTEVQSKLRLRTILTVRFVVLCIIILCGIVGYRNIRNNVLRSEIYHQEDNGDTRLPL